MSLSSSPISSNSGKEKKRPRIAVREETLDAENSALDFFTKASSKDLGTDNVKQIKEDISQRIENFMQKVIPEKITEFQKLVEEIRSITAEEVAKSAVLPSKEVILADIKNRKKLLRKIKKEQKALIKKSKAESNSSETSTDEKCDGAKDLISDSDSDSDTDDLFDEDVHTPAVIVQSTLHVQSNQTLEKMISISKQMKDEMNQILFDLRIWLRLRIPSLLDGDNLGSDIVQAHVEAVSYAIESVAGMLQVVSTYRVARAKMLMKVCSSPYNDDLRLAFVASDVDLYHNLLQLIPNTVNVFISTYDALGKNMAKIKAPRATEAKQWLY
ncbi:putative proteasome activator subunit 1 (PA28 alpha) [Monocercomonoides exilis]|uniref:putative proteasome activator subunit 1 (PA28 alpha) n=1 Tax=Monocercomonoides exilis TaxID=2049356 RepID=UPI003559451D|nr:putative proteasome activator subunit 1 (PA28 alpha) [Monocercomonoides exilis]|eukprot:MONOS_1307.1-p1 / transcript=MONOS_1307.1 / gene=MONOS_1307 / organism=Monocercomonoides_exilis_PA203 / gene_product=unspecified product / transcript_product=unspecified product / location=Mono_scaffold00022:143524-144626(+) / protein_length=327 / sequence_SO=supercontig / SO=protein_coding / is_pseudo=false